MEVINEGIPIIKITDEIEVNKSDRKIASVSKKNNIPVSLNSNELNNKAKIYSQPINNNRKRKTQYEDMSNSKKLKTERSNSDENKKIEIPNNNPRRSIVASIMKPNKVLKTTVKYIAIYRKQIMERYQKGSHKLLDQISKSI